MTAALSRTQPTHSTFFTTCCSKIDRFCEAIYKLAMKIIQSLKRCFGGESHPRTMTNRTVPVSNTTLGAHARNVLQFYRDGLPNHDGVTLGQMLRWDDPQLEQVHNYIQWLFPLEVQSDYNSAAPILDAVTIHAFNNDQDLKSRLFSAFHRMLQFYGLQLDVPSGAIVRAPNFNARAAVWLTPGNHNFLRITRIIHSMAVLGLPQYARALQRIMLQIANNEGDSVISRSTQAYWRQAYHPST